MNALKDILKLLKIDNSRTVILNICTAIGAYGGFPAPPAIFNRTIAAYPVLKWILLAALIYQGGGEQDIQLAIELTIIIYFIHNLLQMYEDKSEMF